MTVLRDTQVYELQQHLDALWEREPQTAENLAEAILAAIREAESLLDSELPAHAQPRPVEPSLLQEIYVAQEPASTVDQFAHRAADIARHQSVLRDTIGE